MTALREISAQYLGLLEMAKTEDLPIEAITDTLEAIEGSFEDKARKVVSVIQSVDDGLMLIDNEIARLQAMKKIRSNRSDAIREYLRNNMEACEISKIECPLFTITLAKGRDVVVIDSEDDLPDEYIAVKTSTQPDKKAILAALKTGEVKGAHIAKSASSLRIK